MDRLTAYPVRPLMKLPAIVTVPHPALRRTLPPVVEFTPELGRLAETMLAVMHEARGVGLAANQIDRPERMFVYGLAEPLHLEDATIEPIPAQAIVNPVITVLDSEADTDDEGCLSIPGLYGPVSRALRIRLEAADVHGNPIAKEISGYEARIIQHETDHLNGILFLDKLTDPTKLRKVST